MTLARRIPVLIAIGGTLIVAAACDSPEAGPSAAPPAVATSAPVDVKANNVAACTAAEKIFTAAEASLMAELRKPGGADPSGDDLAALVRGVAPIYATAGAALTAEAEKAQGTEIKSSIAVLGEMYTKMSKLEPGAASELSAAQNAEKGLLKGLCADVGVKLT